MEDQMYPTRDGNLVRFVVVSEQNRNGTAEAGRPVFDAVTVAVVMSPGSKKSEAVHPIHRLYWNGTEREFPAIVQRFGEEWDQYRKGIEARQIGTSIEQWPDIDPPQRELLKANKVFTLEQLVRMPDTHAQAMGMGFRDLQLKAKAYLDKGASKSEVDAIAKENAELRAMVERLLADKGEQPKAKKQAEAVA